MSESVQKSPEESAAQVQPRVARSYDEMNTGTMVFELQGTVGEVKEAIANLTRKIEASEARIGVAERTASDVRDMLRALIPKIDDIVGFTKHATPNFATKVDIATLQGEISKRPTRWQAIIDFALIAGLAVALLTIGAKVAH